MRPYLIATVALLSSCLGGGNVAPHGVPLNLDYAVPSLVDPNRPWGFWLASLGPAGVAAEVTAGARLCLDRAGGDDTPTIAAEATYDLGDAFAGHTLRIAADIERPPGSRAEVRVGLRALAPDWTTTERWGEELAVEPTVANVQIVIRYEGSGPACVSALRLTVDGAPFREALLPSRETPDAAAVDWADRHAVPLATTDPTAPLDDLAALAPVVADARIVMVGESTHGSSELFALRHRIIRWLVEERGFAVVAFEDHAAPCRAIQDYVETGNGDPVTLVDNLFGVWARQETLAFVRWLRATWVTGRARPTLVGIDLQDPRAPLRELAAFATRHDAELLAAIEAGLAAMRAAWAAGAYPRREAAEHERWCAAARRVEALLEQRTATLTVAAGAETVHRARYNARLVRQSADVSRAGDMRTRDRFLADNLLWLRQQSPPGTGIAVWAHNTHIRFDEDAAGQFVRAAVGDDVVSLGAFTHSGQYAAWDSTARRMRDYALFPGPPDSIEGLLHTVGEPVLALDLRAADLPGWLRRPQLHCNLGLFAADFGYYAAPLAKSFSALLFVDRTTATRGL
ncbi:MAG: erythromycin esterase family protein [Planctomycetes bacterium]|nr:erythromycin esterase family protein [Planctomycetota bacterium]